MTQLQSIANCFRVEIEDSLTPTQPLCSQKENVQIKKGKMVCTYPQQGGCQSAGKLVTVDSTNEAIQQLDSLNQHLVAGSKGRMKQAKPVEQKNEGRSSIEWEGRKQHENLSAQGLSKAQLVREIEVQIALLQSKSKQPGSKVHDLQPLGQQIYDKIDQYYISHGIYNNNYKFSSHFHDCLLNKFSSGRAADEARGKRGTQKSSAVVSQGSNLEKDQGLETRKGFRTSGNLDISVSSVSEAQKNEEQMHIFQTKMTESQLAALDKPLESSSQGERQGEFANQSEFQLKENIRVMQERIVFLIHRLEETKAEVNDLKEENSELQSKLRKQLNSGKELKSQHEFLCLLHEKNLEEIQRLERMVETAKDKQKQLLQVSMQYEKEIIQQKDEIECYRQELADKQNKIAKLQTSFKLKAQEYAELASAYRSFEEEEETRKMELVAKLEESENEKARLKQTIRQYKCRLQTQGLSFKFEQAHRLKQLFEDSSTIHQKEIQKIETQYSKIIQNLKEQLKQSIGLRKQLQGAVVQSLGLKRLNAIDQSEYTFSEAAFRQATSSSCLNDFTSEQLSKEFVKFVQRYKSAEMELEQKKQEICKYEDRISILKEECQERFIVNKDLSSSLARKSEQIQELNKEIQELKRYLRQNLSNNINKRKKNNQQSDGLPSVRRSKIQSKIIQINFAKQALSDHSELTLQSFIKKRVLDTPKNIIRFVLKLINFSQQLQATHRRKLPSLAPHSVLLSVKKLQELEIAFSIISKKEEEQGLIYQAPQILLGFAESSQSHCWTIGVILDEMLTSRKFFKSFGDILSHKDNYTIVDESFKNIEVLHEMIRKSHKQRITLDQAKRKLQALCNDYR